MTNEQKDYLLELARKAVVSAVTGRKMEAVACDDPYLKKKLGCFVTLKTHGLLRGCLGVFEADHPLYQMIIIMAKDAALQDPRFIMNRLRPEELDDLDIEISVLSELEKTENPLSLEIGKHGIYIVKNHSSGCFLPQVAVEAGWDKEEFLSYCCSHKAGLEADAWKNPETDVFLFTAEVFGEKDSQ